MAKFRFKKSSIETVKKNLKKWGKEQERKTIFALQNVGEDIVAEIIKEIKSVGATDTEALVASIEAKKPILTRTFIELQIITDSGYAGIVEYGRRPGSAPPPLHVLVGWAARKGITSKIPVTANIEQEPYNTARITAYSILKKSAAAKGGAKQTSAAQKTDPMVGDFIALISIQRAIGRLGTKGRRPFTNVVDRRKKTIVKDFKQYFSLLK